MPITFVLLIRWLGWVWNGYLVLLGILAVIGASDVAKPVMWSGRSQDHFSCAAEFIYARYA